MKESVAHHRFLQGGWHNGERQKVQESLRKVLPIFDVLNLNTSKSSCQQLIRDIPHLLAESALTTANNVRDNLELELKNRKFFVLIRDDTVHVEKTYKEQEAKSVFNTGREFLRHLAKELKE
ncbi:MAG: hypothetical protein ACLQU4_13600 [Limisphaerales bacterium]